MKWGCRETVNSTAAAGAGSSCIVGTLALLISGWPAALQPSKPGTAPPLSPIHTTTRRSLPSSPAWVLARYSSVCGQMPWQRHS